MGSSGGDRWIAAIESPSKEIFVLKAPKRE
jgi:hypothetical protein